MGLNNSVQASKNGISGNNYVVSVSEKSGFPVNPTQRLAKLLIGKSLVEDSVQDSISLRIFAKYVFPGYEDISEKIFKFMVVTTGSSPNSKIIAEKDFISQVDHFLGILSESASSPIYVRIFGDGENMSADNLSELLMTVYKLAMNYYAEGPQSCRYIFNTINAVVKSAFHGKSSLNNNYVCNWLDEHCPRLLPLLHRFVVHMLSTAHHNFDSKTTVDSAAGLTLSASTPVLEKVAFGFDSGKSQPLLPVSQVWLLSMSLPSLFTGPQTSPSAISKPICAKFYLSRMMGFTCPSHWTLLYNSNQDGLGANRFIHHVTNYRGPTLMFLRGEQETEFCIGSSDEWKESHLYWGSKDCIVLQVLPLYRIVSRGAKMLYVNMSIRGYPLGIRAGSDPRDPIIDINSAFTYLHYKGIPYKLHSLEVWGCGPPQQREAQIEIKKWEGKEIEKARRVKMTADEWSNHPDRYLLELAGRQSYSSN